MSSPSPIQAFIKAVTASDKIRPSLTHHRIIEGREARFGSPARPWPRAVANILAEKGIVDLYSHQAEAINLLRLDRHVVTATPTASGKSLIYNLPIVERFLADPEARALYLSPLKALAQDQFNAFRELTASWPEAARPTAAVYDGDTSSHFRSKIRAEPPTVLFTNPEMLHLSLLPHHHLWSALFAGLFLVVVDEAHTYRGLFGSHMAQVFRRLLRISRLYGAGPAFAFCSATLGNPAELARNLTGLEATPVLESGAPQGKRHFIFINPEEDSPSTLAIRLLRDALDRELRTIVYCQSRRMTELISLWASEKSGAFAKRISAYRAGYLPEERRRIEARMSSGELLAVISTSALELGIDIGNLDLCILVGYPGSVMSTLQRGGRVGRSNQESCVALIAQEDALDQYIVRHPEDFFSRPPEKAVLNPENPVILARHLECAAAELPLRPEREPDATWLKPVLPLVEQLEKEGVLLRSADGNELLAGRKNPQRFVDLRGSGGSVTIEDADGTLIGSMDFVRAMREVHPGAIYLHRGRYYEVTELDVRAGRARARPCKPAWYTKTRGRKDTDILRVDARQEVFGTTLELGRLRVTETITGYEKRDMRSGRLLGLEPLDFPPFIFETEGFWFMIPPATQRRLEDAHMHFMGAIHALEHAMIGILPLLVMTDRNDLGGISKPMHAQTGAPTIFVYDGMPGGAGLTRAAFHEAKDLFRRTLSVMADCGCELGCPSCVHSPKCGSGNRPIDKAGAMDILAYMPSCREKHVFGPTTTLEAPSMETPVPETLVAENAGMEGADMEGADMETTDMESLAAGTLKAAGTARPAAKAQAAPRPKALSLTGLPLPEPGRTVPVKPLPRASVDAGKPSSGLPSDAGAPVTKAATSPTGPAASATPAGAASWKDLPEHFVVMDVETRFSAQDVGGWHRTGKMGVSVAVAYDSRDNAFHAFTQDRIPELIRLMASAPLVVGFNCLRFDYGVLAPHAPGFDFRSLRTLDMLQEVSRQLAYRVSLDNLASATLGAPKSADGLAALRWWKEGRLDLIEEYCRHDVMLTRDIFLHGRDKGYLLFTNKAGKAVRVRATWGRGGEGRL